MGSSRSWVSSSRWRDRAPGWRSFVLGGLIAYLASRAYVRLATTWEVGGGSYGFLRHIGRPGAAGTLAWFLVIGYVLTLAVYAYTFGHYLANVFDLHDPTNPRVMALAIIVALVLVNLRGVGGSQLLEEVTVWAKLAVLIALAGVGLVRYDPDNVS